jgi:hypothetical protein
VQDPRCGDNESLVVGMSGCLLSPWIIKALAAVCYPYKVSTRGYLNSNVSLKLVEILSDWDDFENNQRVLASYVSDSALD